MTSIVAPASVRAGRNRRTIGTLPSIANAKIRTKISGPDIGGMNFTTGAVEAAVINVTVAVPGAVTGLVTVHDPCGIVAVHAIVTEPVNPPEAPTVAVTVPFVPRVTLAVEGALTLKSHAVPLSASVCGLFAALSVIESDPVRGLFTVEDGANVTFTVHEALTATVCPLQLSVSPKSLETAIAPAPKIRGALPVFLIVTACEVLVDPINCPLNASGVVAAVIVVAGVPVVPVPLMTTDCVPPSALSANESVAGPRAPAAPGVNATITVQEPAGGTDRPFAQVDPAPIAKSVAFVPAIAGAALSVNAALPVFSTVIV